MKKDNSGRNIAIISIIIIVIILVIASVMHNKDMEKISNYKEAEIFRTNNEIGSVVEININQFKEIKDSDKLAIIYFGSSSCPACLRFEPILDEFTEEFDLDIFYVNLAKWNRADSNTATGILNNFEGTPTLMIMFGGMQIDAHLGVMKKEELIEYFNEHNMIRTDKD